MTADIDSVSGDSNTTSCVVIRAPGGPDVLEFERRPVRDVGFGEVLVDVVAVGLNRADILQRLGRYPAPPGVWPDVPGLEYAGVVRDVGQGVEWPRRGDHVMGIVGGGAFAQRLVVHSREVIPVPSGIPLSEAAAIPEVFLTVYDALLLQAGLRSGETVLIHSVGSGIGTAAVQVANAIGAIPMGTSRTADKIEGCKSLGLEHGVVAADNRFADAVKSALGGEGVDVVLDTVGGSYLNDNIRVLAPRGRIVVLGLLGGSVAELSLGQLLAKRAQLIGTVLRSRPLEEKAALAQSFRREMLPLFESGRLRPVLGEVMPVARIREAHELMESNRSFGKIVLEW